MFSYTEWITFSMLAIAATLSPGPAVLLAIRNGTEVGFKRSLNAIAGNIFAMLTYALLATTGVAVAFSAFPTLALWAQILGGGYLVFLGLKLLSKKKTFSAYTSDMKTKSSGRAKLFFEAYIVGISNPKALLFYSALFPQFVKPGDLIFIQSATLALTFSFCSFIALCFYSWIASRVITQFSSEGALNLTNRCSGVLFIFLGGGLILNSALR
jgi:threonine/homoserine/homoserine lactone efflux protein